ncbi:MAG: hypothetical protein KBA31_21265 [Alphaproteobacteria bacterium]|nr:hypothetical protein [Alphaproteobacteria bacterium]
MKLALWLVVSLLLAGPAVASADVTVEKMLGALGGRAVWASTTSTMNDSQQNRTTDPSVVRASIWLDFTAPRFRIETRAPDFTTVRVIDGERSWRRLRDGKIEAVPADLCAEDMLWYGAHVYRSIHRLAARDAKLSVALGQDGRLEIFEDGKRLIWFKLDPRGEPFAFGSRDDDNGSICGPWEFSAGGLKHPIWVSNPEGTWRANIKALELNPKLGPELLARPAS